MLRWFAYLRTLWYCKCKLQHRPHPGTGTAHATWSGPSESLNFIAAIAYSIGYCNTVSYKYWQFRNEMDLFEAGCLSRTLYVSQVISNHTSMQIRSSRHCLPLLWQVEIIHYRSLLMHEHFQRIYCYSAMKQLTIPYFSWPWVLFLSCLLFVVTSFCFEVYVFRRCFCLPARICLHNTRVVLKGATIVGFSLN